MLEGFFFLFFLFVFFTFQTNLAPLSICLWVHKLSQRLPVYRCLEDTSKQVTIMRWALQKFTLVSSLSVTVSRASRYSRESTSKVCCSSTERETDRENVKQFGTHTKNKNDDNAADVFVEVLSHPGHTRPTALKFKSSSLTREFGKLADATRKVFLISLSFPRHADHGPSHLHSPVHLCGSSIRCCLVCSSSFFRHWYLARTSLILCCRCSSRRSLVLTYTTS